MENIEAIHSKRRLYWLVKTVRKAELKYLKAREWFCDYLDVIICLAMFLLGCVFSCLATLLALYFFPSKEIVISLYDVIGLILSVVFALALGIGRLFISTGRAAQELAEAAKKKNIDDNGQTIPGI